MIESGVSWRLPLSLGAAPALAAALVGEPNEPIVAALGEALAEPSLSVWTVHRAWALGCEEIRTVASAAEWLARHAQTALNWGDIGSLTAHDEALADAYRRLTAKSVHVAAMARDCAVRHGGSGDEPARNAEEARFLGLLHASEQWWKLAATQPSDAVAVLPAVPRPPPWLAEALGHLTLEPGDSSPSAAVGATGFVKTARPTASEQGELGSGSRSEVDPPPSLGALALAASLPSLSALARRRPYDADEFESAKLEAMAEFAAGAGHEINNPLAVIAGRAQLLLDGEPSGQRRRELAVIHGQAMRVHEMIADMMLFARPPKPKAGACDLPRLLREVVSEMTRRAAERNVEVSLELPDEVAPVTADATQLAAAVRAICDNALAAVDRAGRIGLRLEKPAENSSEVRTVAIVVTDNGSGIPAEVRPHIFDPFYCGRHAGRGLGMGLAKAWRIVRNHDGRIEVDSRPGGGSTFRIVLPAG